MFDPGIKKPLKSMKSRGFVVGPLGLEIRYSTYIILIANSVQTKKAPEVNLSEAFTLLAPPRFGFAQGRLGLNSWIANLFQCFP